MTLKSLLFRGVVLSLYGFLLAAPLAVIYYSFSPTVVVSWPPEGFTLSWYVHFLGHERLLQGAATSALIALVASVASLVIGVPAAYGLVRSSLPGRDTLSAFFLAPLNLPGIVLAIGLLMFIVAVIQPYTHVGLVGGLAPLLAAHLVVTLPWVIRTVSSSLNMLDGSLEEAALGLGASPLSAFFLVTLPLIRPGMTASAIFAFIVSFGNFALSLFFTGGRVITLPVAIFEYVDQFQDPTVAAASSMVILVTTGVVVLAHRLGAMSGRVPGTRVQQTR